MKSVFISGTNSGIGLTTALELDRQGWKVFAGVLPHEDFSRLEEEASSNLVIVPIDITNAEQIQQAKQTIEENVGERGLNALVNNAGIFRTGPMEIVSMELVRRMFEVNVFGHVMVTQALLPLLRQADVAHIVNVSSIEGVVVTEFTGVYAMTKHAIEAFTDTLRLELAPWEIRVTAIQPSVVSTPLAHNIPNQADELWDKYPKSVQEQYRNMYEASRKMWVVSVKDSLSNTPEAVTKAIVSSLNSSKPKARYIVGNDAKGILFFKKTLPDSTFNGVMGFLKKQLAKR